MTEDRRTEKRKIGDAGENAAAEYLEKHGYMIAARNFSCRIGEIDIIAVCPERHHISFVEVKTRKNTDYGFPSEFVGREKQRRLRRTAQVFLFANPLYRDYEKSMDVFEVLRINGKLFGRHIPNAF